MLPRGISASGRGAVCRYILLSLCGYFRLVLASENLSEDFEVDLVDKGKEIENRRGIAGVTSGQASWNGGEDTQVTGSFSWDVARGNDAKPYTDD